MRRVILTFGLLLILNMIAIFTGYRPVRADIDIIIPGLLVATQPIPICRCFNRENSCGCSVFLE
jgi:hypothetical protein